MYHVDIIKYPIRIQYVMYLCALSNDMVKSALHQSVNYTKPCPCTTLIAIVQYSSINKERVGVQDSMYTHMQCNEHHACMKHALVHTYKQSSFSDLHSFYSAINAMCVQIYDGFHRDPCWSFLL